MHFVATQASFQTPTEGFLIFHFCESQAGYLPLRRGKVCSELSSNPAQMCRPVPAHDNVLTDLQQNEKKYRDTV